ncbi:adh short domain containing protein, partial [Asbolus verrucosus]
GIGYETALDFAKRGAKVILACRDPQRAEKARAKIIEKTGNENIFVKLIDLASFDSVRAFAEEINTSEDRLDILVNNAGVIGLGPKKSIDDQLLIMQINYFSSFLLTNLVLDLLKKTGSSRVVNVSSLTAAYVKNFDLSKINKYSSNLKVYATTKLCNILFTIELARRLEGTNVTTYSLHPGAVKTDILRYTQGLQGVISGLFVNLFSKTSEEGAQTTIYCSVAKGIERYSGEHFSNCQKVSPYATATIPGLSKKLWKLSEEIVRLKPEEIRF